MASAAKHCPICGKVKTEEYFTSDYKMCVSCAHKGGPKTRKCLKCDQEFISINDYRICSPCKKPALFKPRPTDYKPKNNKAKRKI